MDKIIIETIIGGKKIYVELEPKYSLGAGFIESIESALAIGYKYGILKGKRLDDNGVRVRAGYWKIQESKRKIEVKLKDEFGVDIEMSEKIKPKKENWLKSLFNN